jgi:hypothetical protein
VTLKTGRGQHAKYLPYAFTENGVAMLSSVLNSDRAISVNTSSDHPGEPEALAPGGPKDFRLYLSAKETADFNRSQTLTGSQKHSPKEKSRNPCGKDDSKGVYHGCLALTSCDSHCDSSTLVTRIAVVNIASIKISVRFTNRFPIRKELSQSPSVKFRLRVASLDRTPKCRKGHVARFGGSFM